MGDRRSAAHDWRETIAAERLEADRYIHDRLEESALSAQSWDLLMVAVELSIDPGDGDRPPTLVADLGKIDAVLPQIAEIESRGGGPVQYSGGEGTGILVKLLRAVGLNSGPGNQYRAEAERIANDYAANLQEILEERGRWETIVSLATEE